MKITRILALAAFCGAPASLSAAPSIAALGIKNSASYANPGFQNGAIAQGSLFSIFGSGMGPAQPQSAGSFPLPTTLASSSASVTVNGTTLPCILIYTSDGQINAILPSTAPVGTGTITVTYNGATSPTAPVKVVAVSPGIYTSNRQGEGPAAATDANGSTNTYINSFRPGQTVSFWATGLGPIVGSDAAVPPTGNLPGTTVTALIGNQPATVSYSGRSSYAGEDQINVTIPSGVSGCFVSVGFIVNGVPSNFTSIAVSNTGAICSDPNLFTSADIQIIANGNPMRLGASLLSQVTATLTVAGLPLKVDEETGTSYFRKYPSNTFLTSLTVLADLAVSPGSCGVFQYVKNFVDPESEDPAKVSLLDAGAAVNVSGGGASNAEAKTSGGNYSGSFSNENPLSPSPPFLKPSATFSEDNGNGGADVGGYNFNATLPPAITWTNKPSAATISRSQDLKITWSGGDPASFVYVLGQSPLDSNGTTAEFVCVGQNADGGLTVPAPILSALPQSATVPQQGIPIPGGVLVVNATTITRATASGLDVFLVGTSSGDGKGAFTFQ